MKRAPLGKADPEPMEEEADTDEEEGTSNSSDYYRLCAVASTERNLNGYLLSLLSGWIDAGQTYCLNRW